MYKYRVLVNVGRGALSAVSSDPITGQPYVGPFSTWKEWADCCKDVYFYWLVGGKTKGDFSGLITLPGPTAGAMASSALLRS